MLHKSQFLAFAVNDVTFYEMGAFGSIGTRRYQVNASATVINPGEPVYIQTAPGQYVLPLATNLPTTGGAAGYLVGIAQSTSTNTSTVAGTVQVFPAVPGVIYLIAPKVAATFGLGTTPNQNTYNALVGSRVLLDLTSSTYSILAVDGATNGCVIENINVDKSTNKVAFSFRQNCTYLGQ